MNQWLIYIVGGGWALGCVGLAVLAAYWLVRLLGWAVEKWEEN
ncbi:hypothetical protein [Kitasatospora fiedleri]|nr:hypothetical protein [Kitasatospora fiedleri]